MRNHKAAFASACLGMLLFGVSLITLGSVTLWLSDRLALSSFSSGLLFSILPVGIIAGSLVFGPVSDRYGHKYFMVISSFCLFLGFMGIAFSPSLVLLQVCIFLFGFGGGAINGTTNALVADISESKGSNLSILGIFFAIGALGMPALLAALHQHFSYDQIVAAVGIFSLANAGFFLLIRFPPAKQAGSASFFSGFALLQDKVLVLIAFFLFCQTAFEAIINNWTTTYLSTQKSFTENQALFTLSLYVAAMAVTRVILGAVLRKADQGLVILFSIGILLSGCFLLYLSTGLGFSTAGLILIGVGLAAGFPVMLGIVGGRHPDLSATAFSLVISIALIGNISINFLMGLVVQEFGVQHLTTFCFILASFMMVLYLIQRNFNKQ